MKSSLRGMIAVAITLMLSLGITEQANADFIINVDFGPVGSPLYSGAGAATFGGLGQTWNGVSADTATGLLNSTGAATSVNLAIFGGSGFSNQPSSLNLAGADALMQDYRFTFGSRRIDITGLTAGDSYDIYIYSAGNGTAANQGSQFFIPAVTGGTTYSPTLDVFGTAANPETTASGASSLILGVNYQRFTGIIGSSGLLSFEQGRRIGETGGGQVINGFQLQTVTAVPEPSSMAVLGIACVGGAIVHVRKRRQAAKVWWFNGSSRVELERDSYSRGGVFFISSN